MGRLWLFAVALVFAAAGAIAVLILRPAAPDPAAANAAIGATVAVDPSATIAPQAGVPIVAQLTSAVHLGDLLDTGPDGAIRVQFTDATFFSVGANASARIDRFVFDPDRATSSLSLAFLRGAFRFVSGGPLHASASATPAVQTPVAAIGVRGTGFNGMIGPGAEALFARIDPGFVSDKGDATTATLILLTDGAIDVDGSGVKVAMEVPGQALFFRRKGAAPIGPVDVPPMLRAAIQLAGSPPSLGAEPARSAREAIVVPSVPAPSSPVRPAPSPSAKPSPKPSPSPTVRPTPKPSPTTRPTPTPSPRVTPRPTPSPRFTPRATPTPRFTPRVTPTPRFTPRPTPTPKATPRATPTPRSTPRPTPRATPRATPTTKPRTPVTSRPRPTSTPVKR